MLSLYGGDTRFFDRKMALTELPGTDYHRRSGRIGEWRSVLTKQQIARINELVPDHFWTRFNWEP